MAGGSFLAMLRISGFFMAVWFAGKASKLAGVSSIVLEILTGLFFAPGLLGASLMPPPYAECRHAVNSVFGVPVYLFEEYCNRPAAMDALVDHHHPLMHMIHHIEACEDELKVWNAGGGSHVQEFVPSMEHRRLQHGDDDDHGSSSSSGEGDHGGSHGDGDGDDHGSSHGGEHGEEELRDEFPHEVGLITCIVEECDKEISHLCTIEPNVFSLIGHTGVSMMIFESGMHFDFKKARIVGPKSCAVAVLGTFLPLVTGMLLIFAFGYPIYPDGFAAGVALAPTSVGIALKLLLEAKCLQKDFGQAIITAAFVDDILSLVIFNMLFSLTSGEFDVYTVVGKPIIGIAFMIGGGALGIDAWPRLITHLTAKLPHEEHGSGLSKADQYLLVLLFAMLLAYGSFTFYLGTHLWGAFVAGMSFASVHHAHHVWAKQTKRWTGWMLRIFFSCTVAFAIPFNSLFTIKAFIFGSILGIFACILTKVMCAPFMGVDKWVIGWAMVGRAEFAYLIAEMAKSAKIMNEDVFAICIWALLYATIFAPFIFRKVLQRHAARALAELEEGEEGLINRVASRDSNTSTGQSKFRGSPVKTGPSTKKKSTRTSMDGHKWFHLDKESSARFMIMYKKGVCSHSATVAIEKLIRQSKCKITQIETQCDADTNVEIFRIQAADPEGVPEDLLEAMQNQVFELLAGLGAHIVWLPEGNALHTQCRNCKLAKVTVGLDALEVRGDATTHVMDVLRDSSPFQAMRATMERHGKIVHMQMLIAASLGNTVEPRSPGQPGARTRGEARETKVEYGLSHIQHGASELPDIQPEDLENFKRALLFGRGVNCKAIRYVQIDPISEALGPMGGISHSIPSLMGPDSQEKHMSIMELRFHVQECGNVLARKWRCSEPLAASHTLLSEVLHVLARYNLELVSVRVDARAQPQICLCCCHPARMAEKAILDDMKEKLDELDIPGHIELVNYKTAEVSTRLCGRADEAQFASPHALADKFGAEEVFSNDISTEHMLDVTRHCIEQDAPPTRAPPPRTRAVKPRALGGETIGRTEDNGAITYQERQVDADIITATNVKTKGSSRRPARDSDEPPGGGAKSRQSSAESGKSNWQGGETRTSSAELRKLRTQMDRLQGADQRAVQAEEELHALRSGQNEQAQVVRGVVGAWRRFGGCVQTACSAGNMACVGGDAMETKRPLQPLAQQVPSNTNPSGFGGRAADQL